MCMGADNFVFSLGVEKESNSKLQKLFLFVFINFIKEFCYKKKKLREAKWFQTKDILS